MEIKVIMQFSVVQRKKTKTKAKPTNQPISQPTKQKPKKKDTLLWLLFT